jgi:hypothetical protein
MTDTLTADQISEKMESSEISLEEANENTRKRKEEGLYLYCDADQYTTTRSNPDEPNPPVCKTHYVHIERFGDDEAKEIVDEAVRIVFDAAAEEPVALDDVEADEPVIVDA